LIGERHRVGAIMVNRYTSLFHHLLEVPVVRIPVIVTADSGLS
jgi:hypothetical protein